MVELIETIGPLFFTGVFFVFVWNTLRFIGWLLNRPEPLTPEQEARLLATRRQSDLAYQARNNAAAVAAHAAANRAEHELWELHWQQATGQHWPAPDHDPRCSVCAGDRPRPAARWSRHRQ